jgi:hypothetical protein
MDFEWDMDKDEANKIKHGVPFETAKTVFNDVYAITLYDETHSSDEERFILIGLDSIFRELNVCHCFRGINGSIIRIISARKANSEEIKLYWRERNEG